MKYLIFGLFLILFFGCNDSKYKKITEYHEMLDTLNITDYDSYSDYKRYILEIRPTKESFCLLDSLKAEIDIEKGKLNYFIGHDREILRPSLIDLPNYLKEKYEINTIELLVGCIITDDDKYYECYERIMHDAIKEKYGDDFFTKSKRIVDSAFHYDNRDKIYSISNSYAMLKRFKSKKYKNWYDSITKELRKNIKIPKGYKVKNDSLTSVYAQFIITHSGEIDSLKLYANNIEKKHDGFLKNQLKNCILRTRWSPRKLYGIKLNTKEYISVFL